jgi:GH25 family lysozyme M1 (1,4-beta-N-acetylmuramidase)
MFFRPGLGAQEQVDAFLSVVRSQHYGPGWLVPALDVEQNVANDGPVSAARYAHAKDVADRLRDEFGGVLLYTNPAMWSQLGNPEWIRDCSIWIAHYNAPSPQVPFHLPWDIWQHHVGPVPGHGPLVLDQNYAARLPLIAEHKSVHYLPVALDWDELRKDRDALILER